MIDWLVPLDIGLSMGLIFAWAVLALSISFRLLKFPDLTIEGAFPLGAVVFAAVLKQQYPIIIAILSGVVAGCLIGALTAILHIRFQLNKFLAGIIVVAISYSLNLRIMGTSNISLLRLPSLFSLVDTWDGLYDGNFHIGTNLLLCIFLFGGVVLIILGLSTYMGMRLRVVGSNPEFAFSLGISISWNLIIGLFITNGLAAFSGILLAMHQGFTDVGMGQGILILALAAMTIGERLLPSRVLPFQIFVVLAAVFGSIIYQFLVAYSLRLGLNSTDLKLATALLVLFVIALKKSHEDDLLSDN